MAKQQLLLIGHGMVGQRYLESLVAQGGREHFDITVLCAEPLPAYDRVGLTSYFTGKTADDLSLVPEGFFAEHDITLKLNTKADVIDRVARTVTTNTGETLGYDKLVLATGSYPFVPPIPGNDRDNCFVYRTIDDLDAIIAASKDGKVGTVVGGGLLGLEAAKALHDLACKPMWWSSRRV